MISGLPAASHGARLRYCELEPGALQLSELNPSITQKATPGLAGEHSSVSNQAIKTRKTLMTVAACSPELQEG